MKVFVGLGNPGTQYNKSRHNIGFDAIEHIVTDLGCADQWREKFEGLYIETRVEDEKVLFIKPLTYMNESGRSVRKWLDYYQLSASDVYVFYDDMDIPFNKLKLKTGGSAGGHNGIKSLISHLGTEGFHRIRLGIDRPVGVDMAQYVLGQFSKAEYEALGQGVFTQGVNLFHQLSTLSFKNLMATYNQKGKTK
jgi:PTH1 family peptidyl-tRNA hydrolase